MRDGRRTSQWNALEPLLADPDPEVRAQTAKVVGDAKEPKSFDALVGLLADASPRVRFFAAIALSDKLGRSGSGHRSTLLRLLRANADTDPYLRHAGVMGLAGPGNSDTLTKAAHDESPAVRMGALLAMRRHEDPAIAGFLSDPDPRFVLEAARAINDVPITAALPGLAGVRLTSSATLPLLRRALNANYRLGRAEHAAVLAECAARSDLPAGARVLALQMLATWKQPTGRDQVMGLWRPILPRPSQPAADALRPKLAALLVAPSPATVQTAAVVATAALGIKEAGVTLATLAADRQQPDKTRAEALEALDRLADPRRTESAQRASEPAPAWQAGRDRAPSARQSRSRRGNRPHTRPTRARFDRRTARGPCGAGGHAPWRRWPGARIPSQWVDSADRRPCVPAKFKSRFDRGGPRTHRRPTFTGRLESNTNRLNPKATRWPRTAKYSLGSDAQPRKRSIQNQGRTRMRSPATRSGRRRRPFDWRRSRPRIPAVYSTQKPTYLLESIVDPNKQIARGFESVVLATSDGKDHTGVLRGEDDKEVQADPPPWPTCRPRPTPSRMRLTPPAMPRRSGRVIQAQELRDLIEISCKPEGRSQNALREP